MTDEQRLLVFKIIDASRQLEAEEFRDLLYYMDFIKFDRDDSMRFTEVSEWCKSSDLFMVPLVQYPESRLHRNFPQYIIEKKDLLQWELKWA